MKLLDKVRTALSAELQAFLLRHDFRSPYRHNILSPLHDIDDYWVGPAHRFHDHQVQEAFERLRISITHLVELVNTRIFSDDRNVNYGTPLTEEDRRTGVSETMREGIRKLNDAARAVFSNLEAFEDIARASLQH